MKTLLISFLIILSSLEYILFSQEQSKPIIISPFIGEKLNSIESEYFEIYPSFIQLQEATFFLNPDGTLTSNIKYLLDNRPIDTTTTYTDKNTLPQLRHKINQKIIKDIKDDKVLDCRLTTKNNITYNGNIYSFKDEKIQLVKEDFVQIKSDAVKDEDVPVINFSEINNFTIYDSDAGVIVLSTAIGIAAGIGIGILLAPVVYPEDDDFLNLEEPIGGAIGGVVGGLLGLVVGYLIKVPIEYQTTDPEVRRIIRDNSLLPSGL